MARLQWCRKHIDDVAEACGLSNEAKREVEVAANFCEQYPDLSDLTTKALRPLIRQKDKEVQAIAIINAEKVLNRKTPTGGKVTKELTERAVKKIVADAELELRKEIMASIKTEKESKAKNGIMEITPDEVDKLLGIVPEETLEQPLPIEPLHPLTENILTQEEIDAYFRIMKKIMCEEDIPKHRKRIDMMIENKTLRVVG